MNKNEEIIKYGLALAEMNIDEMQFNSDIAKELLEISLPLSSMHILELQKNYKEITILCEGLLSIMDGIE